MTVIAYLLYGDNQMYERELVFSLLSMLRFLKDQNESDSSLSISVISDREREILTHLPTPLPIEQLIVSQGELDGWMRGGAYRHGVKPCALMKALDVYQESVILIDTDTYFVETPLRLIERVSSTSSVMHRFEYWIQDEPMWQPIVERVGDGIELHGITVSRQSPMYNSGVLGVDYSQRSLLDRVFELLSTLYDWSPIFNVEQFAAGVTLHQWTNLLTSDDIVKHYWGYEREFVHSQINRSLMNAKTPFNELMHHPATFAVGYPRQPIKDRLVSKVRGAMQGWNDRYRFAYLSYRTALFYASKDREYANIWATIALEEARMAVGVLDGGSGSGSGSGSGGGSSGAFENNTEFDRVGLSLQRDFEQFQPEAIGSLDWLSGEVKQRWLQFWEQAASG
ncbi:hypothetical protein [Egbenema bharatensis]|uniref:hypothetical protein n=1 Tax=Egbenema bharatensis TaxID=3463334 RepID=UPI003A83BC50